MGGVFLITMGVLPSTSLPCLPAGRSQQWEVAMRGDKPGSINAQIEFRISVYYIRFHALKSIT